MNGTTKMNGTTNMLASTTAVLTGVLLSGLIASTAWALPQAACRAHSPLPSSTACPVQQDPWQDCDEDPWQISSNSSSASFGDALPDPWQDASDPWQPFGSHLPTAVTTHGASIGTVGSIGTVEAIDDPWQPEFLDPWQEGADDSWQ